MICSLNRPIHCTPTLHVCTSASLVLSLLLAGSVRADEMLEEVTFVDKAGTEQTWNVRVLVQAADGGLLIEDRLGRIEAVVPQRLKERSPTTDSFAYLNADELERALQDELGAGFDVYQTPHYVICTNAGEAYARWTGNLLERLLRAFLLHWGRFGLELSAPDHPLPVIVLSGADDFAQFAARDAGPAVAATKGYYSLASNRIVLYDLTAGGGEGRPRSADDVARQVATSEFSVATVVHEATHQIAFNSGMHTRYADNPMWLTEGMAMYFETPDLKSRTGWRTAGQVNRPRLGRFREYLAAGRPEDSLVRLIASEERFRDPEAAPFAYAESWALTHFLIRRHREEFVAYLERLAAKPRLKWSTPEERLAAFRDAFNDDLDQLDRSLRQHIARMPRGRR
ncbi:hypothetical protein Mal4_10960 [Maioricimonas rarisocia]|uniref:DUF1570 domain-containing protein n=1 Tax=Maioricimonas rarisocia TaxID=2528026 RepID=A0A517Z2X6_9PLAN|nr:DUF1570 domain-containing protein [Maioricimonas rarisocia]QDU36798.1 hypothetical protein Mal4_10960 [Maioricimonas rarisocia]